MGAAYLKRGPHAATADAVMASFRGAEDAKRLVYRIRHGEAMPDELLTALQAHQAAGEPGRVEGFARELQRALGRTA